MLGRPRRPLLLAGVVVVVVGALAGVVAVVSPRSGDSKPGGGGFTRGLPADLQALGNLLAEGPAMSATVGPAGATLEVGPDLTVIVPPGAFPENTSIEVQQLELQLQTAEYLIERALAVRVETNRDLPELKDPVVVRLALPPERTLVVLHEGNGWQDQPMSKGDFVEVSLRHFSPNWLTAITASLEDFGQSHPFRETGPDQQAKEAAHRQTIERQRSAATKQFFGVGETTGRSHNEICAEFRAVIQANAGGYTWNVPPGFPGTYPLFKFLINAGNPSTPPEGAEWFWAEVEPAIGRIDAALLLTPQGTQISPAQFLQIAIKAANGNVPAGILAAHNFLKDTAYGGRLQADPSFTGEGAEANVNPTFGMRASKLETWRRDTPWSPVGRYDKLGPLYHIFAAMTATVFGSETTAGGAAFGTAALAGEAFLRAVGFGTDVPDREKRLADECGYETGLWILKAVILFWVKPEGNLVSGEPITLTLGIRKVPTTGISMDIDVADGSADLSHAAIVYRPGDTSSTCELVVDTAFCGITVTARSLEPITVEAIAGSETATIMLVVGAEYVGSLRLTGEFAAYEFSSNRVEFTLSGEAGTVSGTVELRVDRYSVGVCTVEYVLEGSLEGTLDPFTGDITPESSDFSVGYDSVSCPSEFARQEEDLTKDTARLAVSTSWTARLSGRTIRGSINGVEFEATQPEKP